ncbi:MAG: LTA synthase family protein [Clostridia bacterium]|nr:LTA synthase family protein [Clostridia bacterium]
MNDTNSTVDVVEKSPQKTVSDAKTEKKYKYKFIALSLLYTLAIALFMVGFFVNSNKLEQLLYYIRVPLTDGSSQAIVNCVYIGIPVIVVMLILTNLIPRKVLKHREKIKAFSAKRKFGFPVKQMKFLYNHGYFLSITAILLAIVFLGHQTSAWEYISGMFRTTKIYEENYVAPQDQTYVFPKEKKNLVYVFLESMESSFASVEEGGMMEENYIPNLTALAKENISFSDNEQLGGARSINGTYWTVAAMVSQTSGVPLTIPISKSNFGKDDTFLPGVYSLGQILEKAGYSQTIMMGSKASFAKRKHYFEEHGNYKIFDYYTATGQEEWDYELKNPLPEDYYVWWGYEDFRLFEYAKDEIEHLAKQDKPFNVSMITVDTHFYDGYKCEYCKDDFDNQYANVISCSDRQVADFVNWIQSHPNPEISEDTVIVLTGDHITMDHSYFDSIDDDIAKRGRRIYNCFINTGLDSKHTKNRTFTSLDMFPTTLAAIGVEWGNNQLGLGVNLFSGQPTLSEKFGFNEFSYQLASSSDFYNEYIMDKNYQKYSPALDEYDNGTGPYDDSQKGKEITEEQRKKSSDALKTGQEVFAESALQSE